VKINIPYESLLNETNVQHLLIVSNGEFLCCVAKKVSGVEKMTVDEKTFRWMLNEDEMATDKLAEGIRRFAADAMKLEKILRQRIAA